MIQSRLHIYNNNKPNIANNSIWQKTPAIPYHTNVPM